MFDCIGYKTLVDWLAAWVNKHSDSSHSSLVVVNSNIFVPNRAITSP